MAAVRIPFPLGIAVPLDIFFFDILQHRCTTFVQVGSGFPKIHARLHAHMPNVLNNTLGERRHNRQ